MQKDEKLNFKRTLSNDWYALKLGAKYSAPTVICSFITKCIAYFEWVFYDAIFVRKIVDALDTNANTTEIFKFIAITGAVFATTGLLYRWFSNVVFPLEETKLFGGIYKQLYRKAANVELKCYEDSDFYNRYTMACDKAVEKISQIILSFFGMILGAVAAVAVFKFMFDIDPFSVLFILAPLVGNFLFGNLKNKAEFARYQEQAPNDKVLNYVNRAMYLPDYEVKARKLHPTQSVAG